MDSRTKLVTARKGLRLSLDGWAVLVAFLLALLVRIGVFEHVPW